ncbi:MAG: T9SS type A sorting domain-containing protein [Bacteroidia bacterium]
MDRNLQVRLLYCTKCILLGFWLVLISKPTSSGQGISNIWVMGYESGFAGYGGTNIDFYHGYPDTSYVYREMNFRMTSSCISDSLGQLLFYTNGGYIANRNNDTMLNGDDINPGNYANDWKSRGFRITQGALTIPIPGNSTGYYLFHETIYEIEITFMNYIYQPKELYCTKIDMTLDSGKGAVVYKNVPVISDTLLVGGITACKHANGRDWWLICHRYDSDIWYTLLITPYGIDGPFVQHAGPYIYQGGNGQSVFSPDGSKFVRNTATENLDIYDFDRCDGLLSNWVHIDFQDTTNDAGASISPNSRYLYTSEYPRVYQFDLQSTNIGASIDTIATYDGFYDPIPLFETSMYLHHLANDGKIYINTGTSTQWMHIINHPDSAGLACDLQQHSFKLPTVNAFTIPNYPNFFLGAEGGTICDSLITGIPGAVPHTEAELFLFPNPVRNLLYVTTGRSSAFNEIRVFNLFEQIIQAPIHEIQNGAYQEINTSSLTPGVYLLELISGKGKAVRRFVKE